MVDQKKLDYSRMEILRISIKCTTSLATLIHLESELKSLEAKYNKTKENGTSKV